MASRGVNKVILIGYLGQKPEVRFAPEGTAFATLSLATSEHWKDKQTGELRELTEWHRVSLAGKLAEIAGQYLDKGSQIYVEGKLRTRKWQDSATGQDKYTTEVFVGVGGTMQMLGSRREGEVQPAWGMAKQTSTTPTFTGSEPKPVAPNAAPAPEFDDDIPF